MSKNQDKEKEERDITSLCNETAKHALECQKKEIINILEDCMKSEYGAKDSTTDKVMVDIHNEALQDGIDRIKNT